MCKMIGQDKIINLINNYSLSTFPKSIIINGIRGSGRHSITNVIAEHLGVPLIDITNDLSLEYLNIISQNTSPTLYIIDSELVGVKEENTLLKFLEEPPKEAFIVVLKEYNQYLLPTITNRCQVWNMESYSKETLKEIVSLNNDLAYEIFLTPGQLKEVDSSQLDDMVATSNKIIDKIQVASLPNTLSLSNKIAFKNEQNKYNLNAFLKVLMHCMIQKLKECPNNKLLIKEYSLISDLYNKVNKPKVNKNNLVEKYLTDLWSLSRECI